MRPKFIRLITRGLSNNENVLTVDLEYSTEEAVSEVLDRIQRKVYGKDPTLSYYSLENIYDPPF